MVNTEISPLHDLTQPGKCIEEQFKISSNNFCVKRKKKKKKNKNEKKKKKKKKKKKRKRKKKKKSEARALHVFA